MHSVSILPPTYPLIVPIKVPTTTDTIIAENPTNNETLPPYKALVNKSLPKSSVPNKCDELIPCNLLVTSTTSGSYGDRNAKIAPKKIIPNINIQSIYR